MNILAIDSATEACSVALLRADGEVFGEFEIAPRGHNRLLPEMMRLVLAKASLGCPDLSHCAFTNGPGAFTGLRVGVSTIKGLAQATGKPTVAVSSLQTLAMQVSDSGLPVCTMLDARKGEVYAGLFQWRLGFPEPISNERVASPEKVLEAINGNTVFIGDGCRAYRSLIVRQCAEQAHFVPWAANPLRASAAAMLAHECYRNGEGLSALELQPVYIRLSEAELNQGKA